METKVKWRQVSDYQWQSASDKDIWITLDEATGWYSVFRLRYGQINLVGMDKSLEAAQAKAERTILG